MLTFKLYFFSIADKKSGLLNLLIGVLILANFQFLFYRFITSMHRKDGNTNPAYCCGNRGLWLHKLASR